MAGQRTGKKLLYGLVITAVYVRTAGRSDRIQAILTVTNC